MPILKICSFVNTTSPQYAFDKFAWWNMLRIKLNHFKQSLILLFTHPILFKSVRGCELTLNAIIHTKFCKIISPLLSLCKKFNLITFKIFNLGLYALNLLNVCDLCLIRYIIVYLLKSSIKVTKIWKLVNVGFRGPLISKCKNIWLARNWTWEWQLCLFPKNMWFTKKKLHVYFSNDYPSPCGG
jgi:hypothetical protein